MAHGFMAALRLSSQSINEPVHKTEMEYVGGNTNLMRGTVTAVGGRITRLNFCGGSSQLTAKGSAHGQPRHHRGRGTTLRCN